MSHRARGVFLTVVAAVLLLAVPAGGTSTALATANASPPTTASAGADVPAPPDTVAADNEFLPDRDLDECISALPQPGCGSEARSGWRQWLVFGVLVVALSFIGWRIVRSVRRSRPDRQDRQDRQDEVLP